MELRTECFRLKPKGESVRKYLYSLAAATLSVMTACGSVSAPIDVTPTEEQSSAGSTTDTNTSDPANGDPTGPSTTAPTVGSQDQDPAEATAADGSMSVELPDDWRHAPELETAYSVFSWTKEDGTQNMSMAPLGPWTQIDSPEEYLDELVEAGNLDDATAVLEGDYSIDGYDGFWMSVEGPGYVANIYYINVDGGIKEVTANAFHTQGLDEIDGLVQTIEFH